MGWRQFTDRGGHEWQVVVRSRSAWELDPVGDNPQRPRTVAPPGYEQDPFELSREELQRLLDASDPGPERRAKSPFSD